MAEDLWDLGFSPINIQCLKHCLSEYPDRINSYFLLDGFKHGFHLGYKGPRIPLLCKNLKSAYDNPNELQNIIDMEVEKHRTLGPFSVPPISNLRTSPIGIVPKKSGGWRLITHLSAPNNFSVNDFIPKEDCHVSYASFNHTLGIIQKAGLGAELGKMDIKSAFRLLPVHTSDFCILGIQHLDKFYIDKCLPFGCSASCKLFENFSTFLHWLMEKRSGLASLDHCLDDFIFIGRAGSNECAHLMSSFF